MVSSILLMYHLERSIAELSSICFECVLQTVDSVPPLEACGTVPCSEYLYRMCYPYEMELKVMEIISFVTWRSSLACTGTMY